MLSQLKWSLRFPPSNSVTRFSSRLSPYSSSLLHMCAPCRSRRTWLITEKWVQLMPPRLSQIGVPTCGSRRGSELWPLLALYDQILSYWCSFSVPPCGSRRGSELWPLLALYDQILSYWCSFSHLLSDNLVILLSAPPHSTAGGLVYL